MSIKAYSKLISLKIHENKYGVNFKFLLHIYNNFHEYLHVIRVP